jgi:hypothetical protein
MPDAAILALTKNFDLPAYIDAFGDSELAFKKAYQALLNNAGHVTLDLGGRKIALRAPVDMAAAADNRSSAETTAIPPVGPINYGWIASDLNAVGTVGNAASATAEKGHATAAHQVAGFIDLLREMRRTRLDGFAPVTPDF